MVCLVSNFELGMVPVNPQLHENSAKLGIQARFNFFKRFPGADGRRLGWIVDNFEESVILNSDSTNWIFRENKSQHLLDQGDVFNHILDLQIKFGLGGG